MRIGLVVGLHGSDQSRPPAPTWEEIRTQVQVAEAVGFDLAVIEDALHLGSDGYWESVAMAGAMAAVTSRIEIGHSVFNAPYRSPALTAKIAETLDEISGGRYILGVGAGNTSDDEYAAFGFPADKRYSRFAEGIEIIHGLLKNGVVDFAGDYQWARRAELVIRGPRPQGPPIVIAAGGPKMLRLAARFGDGWNWWTVDYRNGLEALRPVVEELERACAEVGRERATLSRTLDLYSVDPLGMSTGAADATQYGQPVTGTSAEIADTLLSFSALGFEEIRVNLYPPDRFEGMATIIEAMADVVESVHAG